jgi:beta-lactamase regulating signal transducer with metallopeptidase domain
MHQFNRFYLLGSVLFSLLIPFAFIYVEVIPTIEETGVAIPESHQILWEQNATEATSSLLWMQWVFFLYVFVSSLFLVRFVKSLLDIFFKIKSNTIVNYQNAKLVLVNDTILPHTFWNYIFINKEEYESKTIEKELFTHELTHVTQRHTLDVLIVETLQIALWFNPFFYPLKKAIQLNHEFLADDNVIASHQDIPKYQYLLLDKAAWKNKYYLASNLNYSLTKKRLLMMKTPNSKSNLLWKKLAIIPLLGGLFFLFADRVEAQTKEKQPQIIEIKEKATKASKAQMERYAYLLKQSEKSNQFKLKDVEKMRYIHSIMSEEQKQTVKNINDVLPPPPPKLAIQKNLTKTKYQQFKDKSKYAVWIDGKSVNNTALNRRNHSDFYAYNVNFVHDNAKSKKYPQQHQVQLYTEKYFKSLKPGTLVIEIPEPPKKIKETIEIREKLPPPPPKKVKVLKEKKKEKNDWETFEERMANPKKHKKTKEKKMLKEVREKIEMKERIEKEEEVEVIEKLEKVPDNEREEEIEIREKIEKYEEHEDALSLKESYRELIKEKAAFYINGKKVSAKKAKKYFYKDHDKLQSLDIIKNEKGTTAKLETK